MLKKTKKIFALLIIVSLFFTLLPKDRVLAGGGGGTGASEPTQIINTIEQTLNTALSSAGNALSAISSGVDTWLQKKSILSEMTAALAAQLLERMMSKITQDIVSWVKGEDDEPKFITDFGGFITDAVDQAAGTFIDETLGLGFLCEPFRPFLQVALQEAPFYERAQCSISDIGVNLENFYNDFNQGGWDAWIHLAENPQNTIHGAYLAAYDELNNIKAGAAEVQKLKAQVGGGYSPLECTDTKIQEGVCEQSQKGQVLTPGSLVLAMTNKAITGEFDKKNFEIALYKSKISTAPYITAIVDAMIWRLTQETLSSLGSTNVSDPGSSSGSGSSGSGSYGSNFSSPTYVPSNSASDSDKQLVADIQETDKLLAAFQSFAQALQGISGQRIGSNSAFNNLLSVLRENRAIAKNIEESGECSADPSSDSISEQIAEIEGYQEQLSAPTEGEGESFEDINVAKQAILDYAKALDAYLENFGNRTFTEGGEGEAATQREALGELKSEMFNLVITAVFGEETINQRRERYFDEEEGLSVSLLTRDIELRTTQITSDAQGNQDEAFEALGLEAGQIEEMLENAQEDNWKLRGQYDRCLGSTYQPEINITGGGTTPTSTPPEIPDDWNG